MESKYEEEKKTTFLNTFITEDKSSKTNVELLKNIEKSKNIYRNLALLQKTPEDLFGSYIEQSVHDLKRLIEMGICANLGVSLVNSVHYIAVFGLIYQRL